MRNALIIAGLLVSSAFFPALGLVAAVAIVAIAVDRHLDRSRPPKVGEITTDRDVLEEIRRIEHSTTPSKRK